MTSQPGTTQLQEAYRLRTDADLVTDEDGTLHLQQSRFRLPLVRLGIGARALMLRLAEHWVSDLEVHRLVTALEGEQRTLAAQVLIRRLLAHSWLSRRLYVPDRPILDIIPQGLGTDSKATPVRHTSGEAYRMSRFATLAAVDGAIQASTPLGRTVLVCRDRRLASVVATAAGDDGVDVTSAAGQLGLDWAAAGRILDEMLTARVLAGTADHAAESTAAPLVYWAPEELRLHDRSRPGRHALPVGGTYRLRGRLPPEPLAQRFPTARTVALPVPDLKLIAKTERSLAEIVETRRTIRQHHPVTALTREQLAEFLYRVQRTTAAGTVGGQEVGRRPYPGGGGIHELEIYPLVHHCAGIDPGLYHYDAAEHRLEAVAAGGAITDRVLNYARAAAAMTQPPQVLFVITARVQRLMWKYEGMSYAMTLKNAGVLTGLMYLVATAMRLAPCALGAGDSAAFAQMSGLDPLVEPNVADFALGVPADEPVGE
ncbi:SagB family peptide dehydrogenase [Solwaraspora sp. WMMD937]|uniref:SagB family peptide dehydrogenase n=1 Tax=Solwaraspora sp. WMMD937 TaxID=3016090 RepID=UPI00249CE977|nr:SagB family peptide dehydrogenase [Solwaraspora sp. WMMD937]WFE22203.1 SagB family peptide dehydrogenase [Solwaraspora sp. WMMD937]